MYAVICTNKYYDEIETAVNTVGSSVIYKTIGEALTPNAEILKLRTIPFKSLIIDVSVFADANASIAALKQLKLIRDDIRMIIFTPGIKPGDPFFAGVVNLGIYDLLVPDGEDFILLPSLIDIIEQPLSFSKAHRYVTSGAPESEDQKTSKPKTVTVTVNKVVEKTVEVEKEKILGPVVIGVAGTLKRIGTTFTVLSLASYLSESFKVAVVEVGGEAPIFLSILNSYDVHLDKDKSFFYKNVRYFPYMKDFNMPALMTYDFDYIILDLGLYENCNKNEFWRSQLRVLLCGSKVWELSPLEMFFKENDRNDIVNYIFSFTEDNAFRDISKSISPLKCFQAPYNPMLYNLISSQKDLYSALLSDVIPKNTNKKKRGFLGGFKK